MLKRRELLAGATVALGAAHFPARADGSTFDDELAKALQNPVFLADASGQVELKELVAQGVSTVSTSSAPKSTTQVSARTVDLIVFTEVSSKINYQRKLVGVIWPKKKSGITMAIGYDVGYVRKSRLIDDWKNYLAADVIDRLSVGCGVRGQSANDLLPELADVRVPWDIAYQQFISDVLPSYVFEAENSLRNTNLLSQDSLGALVSLVYNRGASFSLTGTERDQEGRDRYFEMRNIKGHMRKKDFHLIPAEIRSMKRIWENQGVPGLLKRRELEADLFEAGLG